MPVGTMTLGAIVQRTVPVVNWGALRIARHRKTNGPCPNSPTAVVSKPPRNAGMSFPAVSTCVRSHFALTLRIAKIIDAVTPIGPVGHPQMCGTPKQRTTTGWLGRWSHFPTVGTPPVEGSGQNLSGLKNAAPERREIIVRGCGLATWFSQRHMLVGTMVLRAIVPRTVSVVSLLRNGSRAGGANDYSAGAYFAGCTLQTARKA